MKRKLDAMIMPGDPVMLEASQAMKRFYEAQQAGESEAVVESLRQAPEQRFEAINNYQLAVLGHQPLVCH